MDRPDTLAETGKILSVATAVTVTFFAQLLLGAIQTAFVSAIGPDELAGVSLALAVYTLFFLFSLGVVTAITPIVSAARGRGDMPAIRAGAWHGILAGLTFAVPLAILLLAGPLLLSALFGSGPALDIATRYLAGAAWGLPVWVVYVAVRCTAIATGQAAVSTAAMVAAVPVNAGLTWWFIKGGFGLPALGVFGVGLAYALTALAALLFIRLFSRLGGDSTFVHAMQGPRRFDRMAYRDIMSLGIPFALRIVLREGVLPVAAFLMTPYGIFAVAAHAVATRIVEVFGAFAFGFSSALNTRVSFVAAHADRTRVWHIIRIGIVLAALVSTVVGGSLLIFAEDLVAITLGKESHEIVRAAVAVVPLTAVWLFAVGVQSPLGGALNGMKDARGPLLIALFGSWLIGIPLGWVLAAGMTSPVIGLWIGLTVGEIVIALLYVHRLVLCMQRIEIRSPETDVARSG